MSGTGTGEDQVGVLLVDDHALVAQTLALALAARGLRTSVAPLDDAATVVAAAVAMPADLVLLDLDLGGAIGDGVRLVPDLVAVGCRVLVLTGDTGGVRAAHAVELGAVGALRKDVAYDDLLDAVLATAHGRALLGLQERRDLIALAREDRRRRALALEPFARLSAREAQVLVELAAGRGVGEIAGGWFVSEATVRSQVRGVLTKLGVGSQLEAVALARRSGWLERLEQGSSA